jgi:hypothetical protein
MDMHLVSSLTIDDELRLAPRMLEAIGRVLDSMPISYSVRIETALGSEIRGSRTGPRQGDRSPRDAATPAPPAAIAGN